MPGRLIMEHKGADDAPTNKGVGAAQTTNGVAPHPQPDGLSGAVNGYIPNGRSVPSESMAVSSSMLALPPEIRQVILDSGPPPEIEHITEGFQPLGKLIGRAAQECYNELAEVLDEMAQMQVPQQANGSLSNGVNHNAGAAGAGIATPTGVQKKAMLMSFAHRRREMFIKLWILSQWSRQAEDVSKLIDIWTWQRETMEKLDKAALFVGDIKPSTHNAKMPNPDIKTALEVLSTGKASWMPDLNYIPRDPLGAQDIADTLQNLNSILSIRLNLHESLPRHLQKWSIASGRATFVIPGEFEFDVSVADEDPSSQFWFVDIRFLFSPAPQVSDEFKNVLQDQCNEVLGAQGLARCHEFLHNFTLTHKISVLWRQAHEMNAGAWQDSLRIEHVHRVLVIQYWTDLPGGKNWLEFGVMSATSDDRNTFATDAAQPKIGMRWFRTGKETTDSVTLQWEDVSMELIMKRVIARHTSMILASIHGKLVAAAGGNEAFGANLSTSEAEPGDCALRAWLETPDNEITLKVDMATGRLTLLPATGSSARIEVELNRKNSPAEEVTQALAYYICRSIQSNIEEHAESTGWKRLRDIRVKPDAMKAALNQDILQLSFFRGRGWDPSWAIVASITPLGLTWWSLELTDPVFGGAITAAIRIPSPALNGKPVPVSESLLAKIERMAVAAISMRTTVRDLRQRKVPFGVREESVPSSPGVSGTLNAHQVVALYVQLSKLLQQSRNQPIPNTSFWASDFVRLVYHGLDVERRKVLHIAKGFLAQRQQRRLLNVAPFSFGASFVKQLALCLHNIERLRFFIEVLQRRKFKIGKTSPSQISFWYGENASLSADIYLKKGASMRLHLAPENPQQRVIVWLTNLLNDDNAGFDAFAHMLQLSLPLLRALQSIETRERSAADRPFVHSQSVDWHSMVYSNPMSSFSIRLRTHKDKFQWHVQDTIASTKPLQQRPEPLRGALLALYSDEGQDWKGTGAGIVAGIVGIEEVMLKLDEVVSQHAVAEGTAPQQPPEPQQPQHEVINID
ncbi:mediator complex subunit [Coniosporium tulheliwenetii]|uniref:Mediator complex subunit n=1 Tax=Coniosporium tulheliwenetii TaxID=3383036 RepID=A0ACC2ZIF4_9PEZI|nr:mediator complex subunit [Cladosporium sp. JES 115]